MAAEAQIVGAPPIPVVELERTTRRPANRRATLKSFGVTFFAVVVLAAFLSPMLRTITIALKTPTQIGESNAPLWPALPGTFEFEGEELECLPRPAARRVDARAGHRSTRAARRASSSIRPPRTRSRSPGWDRGERSSARGSSRPIGRTSPRRGRSIDFPRLLFNTAMLAIIGTLGTLLSCVLVAYGFSRFRFRGRNVLFLILLSTIFLPAAVTLIPTYTIFVKLGWVGTWLPLLVPAFFANAYDVFLLRQYFMTLPRELDDAAKIDGAGPLRILTSVILPQSWAVIVAVAVFHIVYTWNLYFEPLLYLSSKPDLQPIATGLARFNSIYSEQVELVQAATLMTIVIPMVIFFLCQRFFMRGIVITGVEK